MAKKNLSMLQRGTINWWAWPVREGDPDPPKALGRSGGYGCHVDLYPTGRPSWCSPMPYTKTSVSQPHCPSEVSEIIKLYTPNVKFRFGEGVALHRFISGG